MAKDSQARPEFPCALETPETSAQVHCVSWSQRHCCTSHPDSDCFRAIMDADSERMKKYFLKTNSKTTTNNSSYLLQHSFSLLWKSRLQILRTLHKSGQYWGTLDDPHRDKVQPSEHRSPWDQYVTRWHDDTKTSSFSKLQTSMANISAWPKCLGNPATWPFLCDLYQPSPNTAPVPWRTMESHRLRPESSWRCSVVWTFHGESCGTFTSFAI